MKVLALAGGVGGAKLAEGLAQILGNDLTIIVNTGDDFEHFGLKICPDLDTVCYTLAGLANPITGWGRVDETWHALGTISSLGGPDWFNLGDRDLGTHLERTRRIKAGQPLSKITQDFCHSWGVEPRVLPMSDDPISTVVNSEDGPLAFQDYFVKRQCKPRVTGFRFEGMASARPAPGVISAIRESSLVVICPSNPWVSIDTILALQSLRLELNTKPVIAVSPIIGGKAVKGPVVKMYAEIGIRPSALAVAKHYGSLLEGFVFDQQDSCFEPDIQALGLEPLITNTIMISSSDRKKLASEILVLGRRLLSDTMKS